jgi:tetratricopeptide (TPR) repeat protein
MQSATANNIVLLKGSSLLDKRLAKVIGASAHFASSRELEAVGRQLVDIARQARASRRTDLVEIASQAILSLPLPSDVRAAGICYAAYCQLQRGEVDESRIELTRVADSPASEFKARAIFELGATSFKQGDIAQALYFYIEAGKAARHTDPFIRVHSLWMLAACRGINGDHRRASSDLEQLSPLVRSLSGMYPSLYFDYLNSLAVEFCEVGRIEEAKNVIDDALASPFADRFPEWTETKREVAQKAKEGRKSPALIIAVPSAPPEAAPDATAQPSRNVTSVALIDPGLRPRAKAFIHPTRTDTQREIGEAAGKPPPEVSPKYVVVVPSGGFLHSEKPRAASRGESFLPLMSEAGAVGSRLRDWDRNRSDLTERIVACVHPHDQPILSVSRALSQQRSKPQQSHTARPGSAQARAPPGAQGIVCLNFLRVAVYAFQPERRRIQRVRRYRCVASCPSRGPPCSNRRRLAFPTSPPARFSSTKQRAHSAVCVFLLAHPTRKDHRGRCDSADQPRMASGRVYPWKVPPVRIRRAQIRRDANLCPWRIL